jgi:hypothetical protein
LTITFTVIADITTVDGIIIERMFGAPPSKSISRQVNLGVLTRRLPPITRRLLRQRLLSDHKRPIDFPMSPKIQGNTAVAMLAARCCGKPCDCRPEHKRRTDHESHNNSAAPCLRYSVPRLVHYLRDTAVRIRRSKAGSRLH